MLSLACYAVIGAGGPIAKGRRTSERVSGVESVMGLTDAETRIVASATRAGADGSAWNALPVQSPGQLQTAPDLSCDS